MDREQVIAIMSLLKTAYPRFYANMTKIEAENTISLWEDMFKNDNPEIVVLAVKNLINTFKFPPAIADVKEEIYKLQNTSNENAMEIYALIKKAIGRSIYYSKEEFDKLPELAKRFVVNPDRLRDWAMQENLNHDVLMSQFLKQYEVLKKQEKEEKMMLPEVKEKLNKLLEKSNLKMLN